MQNYQVIYRWGFSGQATKIVSASSSADAKAQVTQLGFTVLAVELDK